MIDTREAQLYHANTMYLCASCTYLQRDGLGETDTCSQTQHIPRLSAETIKSSIKRHHKTLLQISKLILAVSQQSHMKY